MGQGGGWAAGAGGLRARQRKAGRPRGTLALCEDTGRGPHQVTQNHLQPWRRSVGLHSVTSSLLKTSFHKTSST